MTIINLTDYKNTVFIGDPHGLNNVLSILNRYTKNVPDNSVLFFCGDIGIGFNALKTDSRDLDKCNIIAEKRNFHIILIRGNHDNPDLFVKDSPLNKTHITVVEDYTVVRTYDKNILCIGGSISIDRTLRTKGKSYWENEGIKPIDDSLSANIQNIAFNIDIICAHSSPTYIGPINTSIDDQGDLVNNYAINDHKLKQDNWDDRRILNEVYEFISKHHKISHWIYGHFHDSYHVIKNETEFIGLDCYYSGIFVKSVLKTKGTVFYREGPDIFNPINEIEYNVSKFTNY